MASQFKSPELRPSPEEVRNQILQIVVSPSFQGSRRCRQFLEYVCDKSLAGETGALKERAIAIEVFGRRPQSDWADDTIVRVGAREVRKRLAAYYGTSEGAAAKVRVDLPSGCYAPDFRYPAQQRQPNLAPLETSDLDPHSEVRAMRTTPAAAWPRRWIWYSLAALLAVSASAFLAGRTWRASSSSFPTNAAFDRFWGPVLAARQPLLLALGHPLFIIRRIELSS